MASLPRHLAYVSLGSNIDKERNIARAIELLARETSVKAVSSVYETAPVGHPDQEAFLNAAAIVETTLSPDALKRDVLSVIEDRLGRRRTADKNAPRTIDLDIVLFDRDVIDSAKRTIPDPELIRRLHIAVPLAEIAPEYVHPITGRPLKEIAASLAGRGGIVRRDDLDVRRPPVILTIGHSTRAIKEFVAMLRAHGVTLVVDVRAIPRSRRNPQFEQAALRRTLRRARIGYLHMPGLGGLRRPQKDSLNAGWENPSFRGFADYMRTAEFEASLKDLLTSRRQAHIALMCAEAVPWRCHRSLIADALLARGILVEHIMSRTRRAPHTLTAWARVRRKRVTYPSRPSSIRSPGSGLAANENHRSRR